MQFDIIIIGSGPAGLAAAIASRQHNLNVLLITGKPTTAIQPSESVHPGLLSVLTPLGAAHCMAIASRGTYEGIEVNGQYNPLGADAQGPWQGHHIDKALFCEALKQVAVEKGISLIENDTVATILSNKDRVTGIKTSKGIEAGCRYLLDCSGHKRIAGKQLNFKESFQSLPLVAWTGLSTHIPSDSWLFKENCTRFISHGTGWTWLAPEPPDRCTWTRLEPKGKQQFLPPDELAAYPLSGSIQRSNRRWRIFRPVCSEGILLCGDAAGILDPAAGQGILNAMVSAGMAVKTIKACFDNPDFEALHLARYDEWFMGDWEEKVGRLREWYGLQDISIF